VYKGGGYAISVVNVQVEIHDSGFTPRLAAVRVGERARDSFLAQQTDREDNILHVAEAARFVSLRVMATTM
jgi:hypothetical protein